jgi:hypothetical protein
MIFVMLLCLSTSEEYNMTPALNMEAVCSSEIFVTISTYETALYHNQCYFSIEVGSGTHTVTQNVVEGGLVFRAGTVQNMLVCLKEGR